VDRNHPGPPNTEHGPVTVAVERAGLLSRQRKLTASSNPALSSSIIDLIDILAIFSDNQPYNLRYEMERRSPLVASVPPPRAPPSEGGIGPKDAIRRLALSASPSIHFKQSYLSYSSGR
jgi:hypothetical protein